MDEKTQFPNFFSPKALELSTDGTCDCCEFYKLNIGDLFFDTPDGTPERFVKTSRQYAVNCDAGYIAEYGSKRLVYWWGESAGEKALRKIDNEEVMP